MQLLSYFFFLYHFIRPRENAKGNEPNLLEPGIPLVCIQFEGLINVLFLKHFQNVGICNCVSVESIIILTTE